VLTGSSQLLFLPKIKETLAGRISLVHLWPFSLSEVLKSNSGHSLIQRIWKNKKVMRKDINLTALTPADIIRSMTKITREHQKWGGYPPVWQRQKKADKINWLKDYRSTYLERDITEIGRVENIDTFALAQKLLCARTGQLLSISEVARDLSLSVNTVKRYINLLVVSFQCVLLKPYYENIGKRFVKSPKIYFPDVGLNRVILGEIEIDSGASYETWVLSELIKWKGLQSVEPEMYFYRTTGGMEIDFLLKSEDMFLPIEVKSSHKVDYVDGRNLESFMSTHKRKSSIGLIVYRGSELAEIRKNIWAVPDWMLFGKVMSSRL
jgi:predicted AAA+ superfamily ATPase